MGGYPMTTYPSYYPGYPYGGAQSSIPIEYKSQHGQSWVPLAEGMGSSE